MSFIREAGAEPLPGYHLIEPLGSGGFGEVWKCEAPGGIQKAIKFVFGNLNSLDVDGARADQEFKALHRVKEVRHPFVLSLDRIEVVEGELVIVMELADKSLHDAFEECIASGLVGIPRDDLLRYVRDAAEALDHMIEKHNLQHLDIKPRNLFLISDRVKVADFGLVKHLEKQSGSLASVTPLYAPPETFTGKISPHSDQYSLAIVYQEMLTGQRPFNGKNARVLMLQHSKEEPELRSLPEAERPVVARALAKDPAKRFPNCLAFVRALYNARAPIRVETKPIGDGKRPKTMADTLDDIMLLDRPGADEEEVELGTSPPRDVPEDEVSQLGLTCQLPASGALRPTLIIGLGAFGRRALVDLRCRFLDRFGDLAKLPLLRFLYVDPDADACKSALRGAPEVACAAEEIFHLPLQPVGNYRRRMLDQLGEWLPREKLYTMPRSLHTQGIRALGRLAFADHQLRLLARIRRDIQQVTHPDSLYKAVAETGLAIRDNRPRVVVVAAAGGGASGLLPDLGAALNRLLDQLKHKDADVNLFCFCGAPEDPATPRSEQANVYATLTELNHFSDPSIAFTAQYGADAPRIVDSARPFRSIYLLKLAHRSPEALRDAVAHLGSYLFHELTTPLGLRLEASRLADPGDTATIFRSFGTYAVWFPRGLLLRLAARMACARLLADWQELGPASAFAEVEAACARALADPDLRFDSICKHVEESATGSLDGKPLSAALTQVLSTIEEQSFQAVAQDDPGNWAKQAVLKLQDWIGQGSRNIHDSELQKSRLNRALITATQKLAEHWDQKLAQAAFALMEHPGRRSANAEAALKRFIRHCDEAIETHQARLDEQTMKTRAAQQQLQKALDNCLTGQGGFSFFGGKNRRLLRVFVDHLAAFSRQCLVEENVASGLAFFACLRGKLEDRIRELHFCNQRLRGLQESLEAAPGQLSDDGPSNRFEADLTPVHSPVPSAETYWDAIRDSETVRLVLPDGESELETAARRFVDGLTAEQWAQIDQGVQDGVLASRGGLHKACVTTNDLARSLSGPLQTFLAEFLGAFLPVTDVAQVALSAAAAKNVDVSSLVQEFHQAARPLVAGRNPENQQAFLLAPTSDAAKMFGEQARAVVPDLELVRVPGQADLMFCREQGYLTADDLRPMLRACEHTYEEACLAPNTSPHARFDITEWLPIDP